jgi:hypothetical protein
MRIEIRHEPMLRHGATVGCDQTAIVYIGTDQPRMGFVPYYQDYEHVNGTPCHLDEAMVCGSCGLPIRLIINDEMLLAVTV